MLDAPRRAGASEIAVVVLQYLNDQQFSRTVKSFKREAKHLLAPVGQVPRGLKSLADIVSEYVVLKEAHTRRSIFLASNPALRDVFHIIEAHAAARQGGYTNLSEEQQTGANATIAEQREQQGSAGGLQAAALREPEGAGGMQLQPQPHALHLQENMGCGYGAEELELINAAGASPRKKRKRAPKRKRTGTAEQTLLPEQGGEGYGGTMMDLLNLPINERALESLLAGDWQGRFAEGLASCINSRLGPHEQHEQQQEYERRAAQDAAAVLPVYDEADMNTWMASLTEDPGMAALLEPIVAPSQGDGSCEAGGGDGALPDDLQLDDEQDGHVPPEEQPESLPEPEQAQVGVQQEGPVSFRVSEQAEQAPSTAAAAATEPFVEASSSRPAVPAAKKACRSLSLQPTPLPPVGPSAAPAMQAQEQLPAQAATGEVLQSQPGEGKEAASHAPDDATRPSPMQDELFSQARSTPSSAPTASVEKQNSRIGSRSGIARVDALATPKLSAFLADPMSTLDSFPVQVLATRPGVAEAAAAAAAASVGQLSRPSPGAAGSRRENSSGLLFGEPIGTLDNFPESVLPALPSIVAASAASALARCVAEEGPTFSNLSFLDSLPTLHGFPTDDTSPAAQNPPSQRQAPSEQPPAREAPARGLSPIPLRLAPDGRLSSGPAEGRADDSARVTLREARMAASFQERGIWRTEESMDAVLNQDAFEDLLPTPEEAPAALAERPRQAKARGPVSAAAPTDFSGLRAKLSASVDASSCGQQQGGGNSIVLNNMLAGGASAETVEAFVKSLKY